MVRFGETAEENAARRASFDGEIWIKGFKEGQTRLRFLQPTGTWVTYREHYAEGPGYFPCSEDTATCPGCNDSSERTRNRARRYAFNALNENGHVSVFKLGSRVYKTLKAREQRLETIQDRDYTIIRDGKTKDDTTYDIEPGDKYAIDMNDVEFIDIAQVLLDKHNEAREAYGLPPLDEEGNVVGDQGEPEVAEAAMSPAAVTEKARETAEAQTPALDPVQALHSGVLLVQDADTSDLKKFLEVKGIEAPPRAPRGRLETIVRNWIDNNPPF